MLIRRYKKRRTSKVQDFESLTVPRLKEIAKNNAVKGYKNMRKEELINALKEGD